MLKALDSIQSTSQDKTKSQPIKQDTKQVRLEASLGMTILNSYYGEVQPSQGHTVSAEDWCKHNQSDSKGYVHLMSQHPLQSTQWPNLEKSFSSSPTSVSYAKSLCGGMEDCQSLKVLSSAKHPSNKVMLVCVKGHFIG